VSIIILGPNTIHSIEWSIYATRRA